MGNRSRILLFDADPLPLIPGINETKILSALDAAGEGYASEFSHFFEFDIEDDQFYMEPTGETGKGYDLIDALAVLIGVLSTLARNPDQMRGFRFRFEFLGEDGDYELVQSDGEKLTVTPGVVTYPGAPQWPARVP